MKTFYYRLREIVDNSGILVAPGTTLHNYL